MTTTNEPEPTTRVRIPGTIVAHLNSDGEIDHVSFSPAGSCAGYFGPTMEVEDGPEIDEEPFWATVTDWLNEQTGPGELRLDGPTIHWAE